MPVSRQEARCAWECDKKKERRHLIIGWGIAILIFLICMSIRYNAYYYDDKFVLIDYAKALWLWISIHVRELFGVLSESGANELIEEFGSITYYGATARLKLTLMSFIAGGALAVSGAIFQTVYQNPMASPNIIGASAGVRLGNVLVVALYSTEAATKIYLRYEYCYGFTAICLGLILLFGKIAGGKKSDYSILEMVMAGSIVSQVIQVFSMYLMYNLEEEDLLIYEEIALGTYIDTDVISMIVFFGVMAISLIPVIVMRYGMNAVAFNKSEARTLGISNGSLKIVSQICGALMVTCAMIHFGEAGMVSMVIPYIVRQSAGSDFRKLLTYSIISSGSLMMVCRLVTQLVLIDSEPIPATFIMNMILMPAFLVILARSGKRSGREAQVGE